MQVLLGIVIGIFISTVGVNGLVNIADKGVQKVQEASKEVAK
jgi:glycine cleavage system pyridoxal-binding protein P